MSMPESAIVRRHTSSGRSTFFVARGIDGRGDERQAPVLETGEQELPHREDQRVVLADQRHQEVAHLRIGRRGVDVAPPDPLGVPAAGEGPERRRLGVVDHVHVVERVEHLRGALVHLEVDAALARAEIVPRALERVVDRLGHREELRVPVDEPPVGLKPQRLQDRDVPRQQLGHAAPGSGGVDVADAQPLEGLRQAEELVDEIVPDQGAVALQATALGAQLESHRQPRSACPHLR